MNDIVEENGFEIEKILRPVFTEQDDYEIAWKKARNPSRKSKSNLHKAIEWRKRREALSLENKQRIIQDYPDYRILVDLAKEWGFTKNSFTIAINRLNSQEWGIKYIDEYRVIPVSKVEQLKIFLGK